MATFYTLDLLNTLVLCSFIIMVCLIGDYMLSSVASLNNPGKHKNLLRALADSSTHALVGFLVWAVVENLSAYSDSKKWLTCFAAGVLAASVDVDHFLAAGALDLEKALHLGRRAPFHNTSLVCVVTLVCLLLQKWISRMWIFALMFLCSWLSHHIRDANHRGFWFFPFGHTPVLSTHVYLACILTLAVCVRVVYVVNNTSKSADLRSHIV